jgi:hypothetical protein
LEAQNALLGDVATKLGISSFSHNLFLDFLHRQSALGIRPRAILYGTECAMYLTTDQRILRIRMRMYKIRQKFDALANLGLTAKCRECIRQDRYLRKQLAKLEAESRLAR